MRPLVAVDGERVAPLVLAAALLTILAFAWFGARSGLEDPNLFRAYIPDGLARVINAAGVALLPMAAAYVVWCCAPVVGIAPVLGAWNSRGHEWIGTPAGRMGIPWRRVRAEQVTDISVVRSAPAGLLKRAVLRREVIVAARGRGLRTATLARVGVAGPSKGLPTIRRVDR